PDKLVKEYTTVVAIKLAPRIHRGRHADFLRPRKSLLSNNFTVHVKRQDHEPKTVALELFIGPVMILAENRKGVRAFIIKYVRKRQRVLIRYHRNVKEFLSRRHFLNKKIVFHILRRYALLTTNG